MQFQHGYIWYALVDLLVDVAVSYQVQFDLISGSFEESAEVSSDRSSTYVPYLPSNRIENACTLYALVNRGPVTRTWNVRSMYLVTLTRLVGVVCCMNDSFGYCGRSGKRSECI